MTFLISSDILSRRTFNIHISSNSIFKAIQIFFYYVPQSLSSLSPLAYSKTTSTHVDICYPSSQCPNLFPMTAITNQYKLCLLKQLKCFKSSRNYKIKAKVKQSYDLSKDKREGFVRCYSFSFRCCSLHLVFFNLEIHHFSQWCHHQVVFFLCI